MPTIQWITSIPIGQSDCLHTWAHSANVELSLKDDIVWMRGKAESEEALTEVDQRLRAIPGAERFQVVDTNLLRPIDSRLPTCAYPDGPWKPAAAMLCVQLPPSGLGSPTPSAVTFRTTRGATVAANSTLSPSILECNFAEFSQWAITSSEARLGALAFACNESGRTIVRGNPLPPVAGTRWIEYDHVAVRVGHSWQPPVSVQTLNQALETSSNAIHFLEADGRVRVLSHSVFVMAMRSSVRLTAHSISDTTSIGGAE
jgi:hypothetical protein